MSALFGRYDAAATLRLLEDVGMLDSLRAKGFGGFDLTIDGDDPTFARLALHAAKDGQSHLLLETCLRRLHIPAATLAPASDGPLDLLLVHWVREQDPTGHFTAGRPPLPLQEHPGLGVLRRAFRVAAHIGADLSVDGIANQPKFFHDAVIFHRSRLFLFIDGSEQGRFEALERDLGALELSDATLAVAGWCVRDQCERVLHWRPGFQVFPLSARLTAHFHAPAYADAVARARDDHRFRADASALATARREIEGTSRRDRHPPLKKGDRGGFI